MKYAIPQKICLGLLLMLLLVRTSVRADPYPIDSNVDVLHYHFALRLFDHTDRIEGMAKILVHFRKAGVHQLRLDLVNSAVSADQKGMVVDSVRTAARKLGYQHEQNVLMIFVSTEGRADATEEVLVYYHGLPADGLYAGKDKFGDRGFFSDNWPDKTRHWLPTVDHPHEKATCEFLITAPIHYQVVSNGLIKERTVINDSTLFTHWKQSVPISAWLYTLGISRFAVQELEAYEGKSIQSWVYAKERDAGFRDFASPTKEALTYFSDYVGPFAYEKIANIESPVVGGGMEAASAIGYSEKIIDGAKSKRIRNVIIHELAHQWFGNAVTEKTWDDVWLSESFATYFTLRFIRHAYGEAEFRDELKKARSLFERHLEKEPAYPIVASRSPDTGPVTSYAVTYQKGAWVLHMLNERMGEAAFQKGIREYYQLYFNATASTRDFISIMQKHSNNDLDRFFKQWLLRPDRISTGIKWNYDSKHKQLLLSLEQDGAEEDAYQFPLILEITGDGKTIRKQIDVRSRKGTWSLPLKFRPALVVPDPEGNLLATFRFTQ